MSETGAPCPTDRTNEKVIKNNNIVANTGQATSMTQKRIGMIGTGLMGTAMTRRLLKFGYDVYVWNRTKEKTLPLLESGAHWSDSPLRDCDRVILSLYNSQSVEDVMRDMQSSLRENTVIVDTTTGLPEDAIAMAHRLARFHVSYLDAPISGSSVQTENGEAVAIVGGDERVFDSCRDLFDLLVKKTIYAGEIGNGAKMKLVTNLVLGLNRAALSEGLIFAETLRIPPFAALQTLMESAAFSTVMNVKGMKMVNRDFRLEAKLSQHLKDLKIIEQIADRNDCPLPLTKTHIDLLEMAEEAGLGGYDNSAVIEAYDLLKDKGPENVDSGCFREKVSVHS